jgi:hypothetical protein
LKRINEHDLETYVERTAKGFPYPATPPISGRAPLARRRAAPVLRLALAAALIVAVFLMLAVPDIRAGVGEFLRFGAIRLVAPAALSTATPSPTATATPTATPRALPTVYIVPTATPLGSVLDLPGETTLDAARQQVRFDIPLPAYPADLGAPAHVFVEHRRSPILTLVWVDKTDTRQVRLVLQILDSRVEGYKFDVPQPQDTTVNGLRALWLDHPHRLIFYGLEDAPSLERDIVGNVLLWTNDNLTYRLESAYSRAESVRIAESLR